VDYRNMQTCEFYSKLGFVVEHIDDDDSEVGMSFFYQDDPGLDRP